MSENSIYFVAFVIQFLTETVHSLDLLLEKLTKVHNESCEASLLTSPYVQYGSDFHSFRSSKYSLLNIAYLGLSDHALIW